MSVLEIVMISFYFLYDKNRFTKLAYNKLIWDHPPTAVCTVDRRKNRWLLSLYIFHTLCNPNLALKIPVECLVFKTPWKAEAGIWIVQDPKHSIGKWEAERQVTMPFTTVFLTFFTFGLPIRRCHPFQRRDLSPQWILPKNASQICREMSLLTDSRAHLGDNQD